MVCPRNLKQQSPCQFPKFPRPMKAGARGTFGIGHTYAVLLTRGVGLPPEPLNRSRTTTGRWSEATRASRLL
jgi:hypothetical protein